ncbi:mediator of DNA damage checkpoint protein 1-like [Daphnia carinata]|uniref:mediator of DNA damage checkpoint protein 1-like n=1 Tax=Daphnia carinata TaxID=120202 RepID=UPI00257A3250|nr:mediator of DNA damage checkpoint protein 1-like [Daphnia carinata]
MCDSEEDLSSMSTVPYEYDASDCSDSIYDKETQAIGEIGNGENKAGFEKHIECTLNAGNVLYDGPTQPLKFINTAVICKSPSAVAQTSLLETKQIPTEDFDSDCDTIPESPVLCQDSLCDEVDFQQTKTPSIRSTMILVDDDKTQPLPPLHPPDIGILNQDCTSPEIALYDGPTQRLVITNPDTLSCSREETCTSPSPTSQNTSLSDLETLPISPVHYNTKMGSPGCYKKSSSAGESARAVTPLYDGPTQPLGVRSNTEPLSVGKRNFGLSAESNCDMLSRVMRTSTSSDMEIEDDNEDRTQVNPNLMHFSDRVASSGSTLMLEKKDEDSDCETLPSSPVHPLSSIQEVPSTQSMEDRNPLQRTEAWSALKKVDNWDFEADDSCPLSPDLFVVSSPCPEPSQNLTTESEKKQDANDSVNDPTLEMDRVTIPVVSPVFDFHGSDNEESDEETQAISPAFHFQGSPAFVAETPFVPVTSVASKEIPFVAETPFVVESLSGDEETPRKKRKIIRRSGQACRKLLPEVNSSINNRTSTPHDMDLDNSEEERRAREDAVSIESDFELTFASHYSALPTPTAFAPTADPPFVGFEATEVEEPTIHLEKIRQVIVSNQVDALEEAKASQDMAAPLAPSAELIDVKLPTPRRSSRKPVPKRRNTLDFIEPDRVEPVAPKRRTVQLSKTAVKVEVMSSDETDASEPTIKRRPGRPRRKIKVEPPDQPDDVESVAAKKRSSSRPARPVKLEVESMDEPKSVARLAPVSLALSDAAESGGESAIASNRTTRNTRGGRKKGNTATVTGPAKATTPVTTRKTRNQIKQEPMNESVSESALNKTTSQRRSKRGVNNNTDTSSIASSSPSIPEATRRRKRPLAGQVRVLFTVINDDGEHGKIVESLGGRVVTTFKDCSVLVTDRIRRTLKFLCCVGLGTPIVGVEWLTKCRSSRKFVDPWLHLLLDKAGEEKFNFKLSESLEVAKETPLLSGWIFHATPSVVPKPVEMQEIVESCGGIYFEESDNSVDDNKIVISCEADRKTWPSWKKKCATLVDKEAILSGVLKQVFEPDKFKLDA